MEFADKMRNINSYDQTEQLRAIVEQMNMNQNQMGNTLRTVSSPTRAHKVNARFDGTMKTTVKLDGIEEDFRGTLGDNASALQMQVVECLDLLNKREIAMKGMAQEIDRTHKTLRSCLIVQDKLMVDSFKQKRDSDAALKEERFRVME